MEIIFLPVVWLIRGLMEGIAGSMWPTQGPKARWLQRSCIATLLGGLGSVLGAVLIMYFSSYDHVAYLFALGAILIVVSGYLGNKVEQLCHPKQSTAD